MKGRGKAQGWIAGGVAHQSEIFRSSASEWNQDVEDGDAGPRYLRRRHHFSVTRDAGTLFHTSLVRLTARFNFLPAMRFFAFRSLSTRCAGSWGPSCQWQLSNEIFLYRFLIPGEFFGRRGALIQRRLFSWSSHQSAASVNHIHSPYEQSLINKDVLIQYNSRYNSD